MKTTAPTVGGTQLPHEKYVEVDDRNVKETYQIIENRINDAMPRISSPIQKTEVFSPLNIFYQMSMWRQKLLNITSVRFHGTIWIREFQRSRPYTRCVKSPKFNSLSSAVAFALNLSACACNVS